MAGVQAVPALGDDEHGHYDADDFSSLNDSAITEATLPLSDEHFRLEKEYEAQIEQDVNAPRGTPSSASMTAELTSGGVQQPQRQAQQVAQAQPLSMIEKRTAELASAELALHEAQQSVVERTQDVQEKPNVMRVQKALESAEKKVTAKEKQVETARRLLDTAQKAATAKADKEAATALKKAKQSANERHAEEVAYAVVKLYQSFTTRALEFSTTVQIL